MNPAAAAAALALIVAAPLSELGRAAGRRVLDRTGRALALAAGLLLLVAAARPAARPAAVLALAAAAVVPRGLTCLIAAAAAVVAAVRPVSESSPAGLGAGALVAAVALALAASALQDTVEEPGPAPRAGAEWTAAAAGAVLVLTLIVADGGRLLRWRYGLGAGATRLELPGAVLILGLALLVSLAGSLSTAVHLLARTPEDLRAGRTGQSLLILGAGLGALGVAVVAGQGLSRSPEAVAAAAVHLAAMLLAVGMLVLALIGLLAAPPPPEAAGGRSQLRRERMLRVAAAAAMLAAATAGVESWRAEGTYATPALAETASAALLGLVAVQPTRLGLPRIALFVTGLLFLLSRTV